jgi:hypothetical protein
MTRGILSIAFHLFARVIDAGHSPPGKNTLSLQRYLHNWQGSFGSARPSQSEGRASLRMPELEGHPFTMTESLDPQKLNRVWAKSKIDNRKSSISVTLSRQNARRRHPRPGIVRA